MSKVQAIRKKVERLKGRKTQLKKDLQKVNTDIANSESDMRAHEQALEIVKHVSMETQKQLQVHIADITSVALEAVFDNPYKLRVEFVERRGKTECDLLFERDGVKIDPLSASGGGVVDVAAFALRIVCWSMMTPKTRNTIILDEPMRFLSVDLQEKASLMIKELSEKLGLQFIIITHESQLGKYADRVFAVTNRKGISHVKQIEG